MMEYLRDKEKRSLLLFIISAVAFLVLLFIPCKDFMLLALFCISLVMMIVHGMTALFPIISPMIKSSDQTETKKKTQANVARFRMLFLNISLIISLGIVLLSFSWENCEDMGVGLFGDIVVPEELEVEVPPSKQERPPPPPPPPPKLEIVEDEEILEEEPEIEEQDIDEETEIQIIVEEEEETGEEEIFMVVEQMPEYPGGIKSLYKYIGTNIRYPNIARENGVEGKVYVNFVVEPTGKVSNVKVLRGIGAGCDKEAIRVVKTMPAWTPGRQRGKPVRVSYNLPISFKIQ